MNRSLEHWAVCNAASLAGGRVAESHSGAYGAVTCYAGWTRVRTSLYCSGKPASFSARDTACKRSPTSHPLPTARLVKCSGGLRLRPVHGTLRDPGGYL